MEILQFAFKDDGIIPNSDLPLIVYKSAFAETDNIANVMEQTFAGNNWTNAWHNGVFSYHHYHSITHEVVGVYKGYAILHMGGEAGEKIEVNVGDVLVIPAGTGHKLISATNDFKVIGAYPNGMDYDLLTGKEGDRAKADNNIAKVPLPETDPVRGKDNGIIKIWK